MAGSLPINKIGRCCHQSNWPLFSPVHHRRPADIQAQEQALRIGRTSVRVFSEKSPENIPWKDLGVQIVLECTGIFTKRADAARHLTAGAKKVLVSAPSPDPDLTIAFGVNHASFTGKEDIVSCASCTTNCLAPVAQVLDANFGISAGTMTTIHSYTNDQNVLDLPHKDFIRMRAAALSMIPTSTGAAKAVGLVLPALAGKLDGFAVRVPTPNVSLCDLVIRTEKAVTRDGINEALRQASNAQLRGILAVSDEELVSCDYIGNTHSSIVDAKLTLAIDPHLAKVVAWYDNEVGFSCRMIDCATYLAQKLT